MQFLRVFGMVAISASAVRNRLASSPWCQSSSAWGGDRMNSFANGLRGLSSGSSAAGAVQPRTTLGWRGTRPSTLCLLGLAVPFPALQTTPPLTIRLLAEAQSEVGNVCRECVFYFVYFSTQKAR
jgi:hypothetical protein